MRLSLFAAATLALTGLTGLAAPALAGGHTQAASDDMLVWAYPTKHNYCPAGLQPVMVGGVVCCGTPNTHHNPYAHPVSKPRKAHAQASYVAHGKGYSDGAVVYEKGQ